MKKVTMVLSVLVLFGSLNNIMNAESGDGKPVEMEWKGDYREITYDTEWTIAHRMAHQRSEER